MGESGEGGSFMKGRRRLWVGGFCQLGWGLQLAAYPGRKREAPVKTYAQYVDRDIFDAI